MCIENIINNFLLKKNSFIFESVEKRRIRGRYTIIGADPDKIWEFRKKKYITNIDIYNYILPHHQYNYFLKNTK